MIKIVTSKEINKIERLPIEVIKDVKETMNLLDCTYGVERNDKDLGGYIVVIESKKDIEWLSKEAYLDIYNDYPELMEQLSDEWFRLVFLLNSDFSIVVYGTKELIQLDKVKL